MTKHNHHKDPSLNATLIEVYEVSRTSDKRSFLIAFKFKNLRQMMMIAIIASNTTQLLLGDFSGGQIIISLLIQFLLLLAGVHCRMWLVSENGLSSPLCWKESPCNGLEDAVNNSKSGDTILITNNGNRSGVFSLCLPGVLDKFLYFKGVRVPNSPKIGCSDNQRYVDERTKTESEYANKFYKTIKPMLEITNGAAFENIWFDTGSIVIYNANVTFTNCTLNDVTIYIMGQDILSIYSLGYNEVADIWHVIERIQMSNGSLQCQDANVLFNNTTWNYVEAIKPVDNQTGTIVDGLIHDGIQTVCTSITLNIFNSFLADKIIFKQELGEF